MFNKSLPALAALIVSAAAIAQTPAVVGTAQDVQGLVTVSDGATVGSVVPGSAVVEGSRYVTGSNGTVVLKLGDRCDVVLRPNQSVIVNRDKSCPDLWASIQNLGGDRMVAGFLGGGGAGGVALSVGTLLGVAALDGAFKSGSSGTAPGAGGGLPNPNLSGL